jgi:hypothetical protein
MKEIDAKYLAWMTEEVRRSGLATTLVNQYQGKRWAMEWLDPYIMLCGS